MSQLIATTLGGLPFVCRHTLGGPSFHGLTVKGWVAVRAVTTLGGPSFHSLTVKGWVAVRAVTKSGWLPFSDVQRRVIEEATHPL